MWGLTSPKKGRGNTISSPERQTPLHHVGPLVVTPLRDLILYKVIHRVCLCPCFAEWYTTVNERLRSLINIDQKCLVAP